MNQHQGLSCTREGHTHQPIRYLCLEEQCKGRRMLCQMCVRDSHGKHSRTNFDRYVQPLARLGMNYEYPSRQACLDTFETAKGAIAKGWERITSMVGDQTERLQLHVIDNLHTVGCTFSETVVQEAAEKLNSGKISDSEVEEYVQMINLLGRGDFDQPEKVMEAVMVIQKNLTLAINDFRKKLENLLGEFQNKMDKMNLGSRSLDSIIQDKDSRRDRQGDGQFKRKGKAPSAAILPPVKQLPSIVFESVGQKESSSEEVLAKVEEDTLQSMRELRIGSDSDSSLQIRGELRSRVRRVVVNYCRNPEVQLAKILSLSNLQELQINWYQLAKKEYLIKIMNNLPNLKILIFNCANQFDEECSRIVPKKLAKIRKLQYGWDFLNALRDYDEGIYFRLSPYTNRGCPLKTSVTREMVVGLKRLENVWLGDFMYFRPSNNEIPFKNIKEFTLGQTKGKYFRIPQKLCVQLKDMTQLLSLSILHVRIDQRKLHPILVNNPLIKTFVIEGCQDISDESLKTIAVNCKSICSLSIRESRIIEGSPIWEMTSLSTLILVQCSKIRPEEVVAGLPRMTYLSYLNLYGNKWVDNDVVKQIPNVANFSSLNLGRTSITDGCLPDIAQMRQLKSLCLDCNKLNGFALVNLARNVKEVEKLSLWGLDGQLDSGSINDFDLEELAKEMTVLNHLSIRFCKKLTGDTFLQFRGLKFLQTDFENLTREVEEELITRGVKVCCQLSREVQEL